VGGDVDAFGNQTIRTIEVLDDSRGLDLAHWELLTEFPNARKGFSTCAVGSKIFVFSGDSRTTDAHDDDMSLSTWDAFDVLTGKWDSQHTDVAHRTMVRVIEFYLLSSMITNA
jgi:hypothetical protein